MGCEVGCEPRHGVGFSLTELLVVIALISLLTSLLLPALQAARSKAQAAACWNNLHEIGVALQRYHADQDEFALAALCGPDSTLEGLPLALYCPDARAFVCPSVRGTEAISYGINGRLVGVGHSWYRRRDLSRVPVAFDAHVPQGSTYSDLDYRHAGDANVLYADSHVEPRYVGLHLNYAAAVPLPGPGPFNVDEGVVTPIEPVEAVIRVLGAAYVGNDPILAYYRRDGGTPHLVTANARHPSDPVVISDLQPGETLTIAGQVQGGPVYESDDGSGHVWTLVRGDPIPSLAGYGTQPGVACYLADYTDANGCVDIPEDAVLYLFELSASIDYQHNTSADFQDLVVLVTFRRP